MSEEQVALGLPVMVTYGDEFGSNHEILDRISEALQLIESYQPRILRRMRNDVALIWVRRIPTHRAEYRSAGRVVVLDTYFSATFPVAAVASSIVHEATHARIRRRVRRYPVGGAAKEERICRRAELRFGLAIPGGREVVRRAERSLDLPDDEVAPISDHQALEHRASQLRLQEIGAPVWFRRLVDWRKQRSLRKSGR